MFGSPDLGPYESRRGTGYPVSIEFVIPTHNSRLLALLPLGLLIRGVFLIPHYVVLFLLAILVAFAQLILWIPVLFVGRYPRWGYTLVGGYIRWSTRVLAYSFCLTDAYPPFTLKS